MAPLVITDILVLVPPVITTDLLVLVNRDIDDLCASLQLIILYLTPQDRHRAKTQTNETISIIFRNIIKQIAVLCVKINMIYLK